MINRILINREECEVRVAFLDNQDLVELHTEKFDDQTIVNNIYRGRVQDVVPGLQAAFIDVGLERNMFLHFMDIRPESLVLSEPDPYEALRNASEQPAVAGRIERKGRRPRVDPSQPQALPPVKKGDEIIIQVVKDEIGTKAPRVTTNLSLAGRYLVMLPFPSQEGGVSKKIGVGVDRFRLKKLLGSLKTDDHSFIVRTAGVDQPEEAIIRDAEALENTWADIIEKYRKIKGPGLIHNDHNLLSRLIRDAFPSEFDEVICDTVEDAEEVRRQMADVMPQNVDKVKLHEGVENIFEPYGAESQIDKSMAHKVWLKSGGYLIIDENEALTAIDVNTGRFMDKKNQEKTSLKTNLEACEAIAQQIRTRDIGGIIVIDFIDMEVRSHQDRVSEELKKFMKGDRAKTSIGRIGDFGLCILTRKRQRMSLQNQICQPCPYCEGTGFVKKPDEIYRKLKYEVRKVIARDPTIGSVLVSGHPHFIDALTRRFRIFHESLRRDYHCDLVYRADVDLHWEDFQITPVKRPTGDTLRVPQRITSDVIVLPAIEGTFTPHVQHVVNAPTSDEASSLEIDLFSVIAEENSAATSTPATAAPATAAGKRRRRRRESSSERRSRRRRARLKALEEQGLLTPAQAEELRLSEAAAAAAGIIDSEMEEAESEETGGQLVEVDDDVDADSAEDDEDDEAGETAADAPSEKRRGRRGRRGGRNRRRRDEDAPAVATESAPAAAAKDAAAAPAAPAPPAQGGRQPRPPRRDVAQQGRRVPQGKVFNEANPAAPVIEKIDTKSATVIPVAPAAQQIIPVERPKIRLNKPPAPKAGTSILAGLLDQIEEAVETVKAKGPVTLVPVVPVGPPAPLPAQAKRKPLRLRGPRSTEEIDTAFVHPEEIEEVEEVKAILTEAATPVTPPVKPQRPVRPARNERGGGRKAPVEKKSEPARKVAVAVAPAPKAKEKEPAKGRKPAAPAITAPAPKSQPKAPVKAREPKQTAPKPAAAPAKGTKQAKPAPAPAPAPAKGKKPVPAPKKASTPAPAPAKKSPAKAPAPKAAPAKKSTKKGT